MGYIDLMSREWNHEIQCDDIPLEQPPLLCYYCHPVINLSSELLLKAIRGKNGKKDNSNRTYTVYQPELPLTACNTEYSLKTESLTLFGKV